MAGGRHTLRVKTNLFPQSFYSCNPKTKPFLFPIFFFLPPPFTTPSPIFLCLKNIMVSEACPTMVDDVNVVAVAVAEKSMKRSFCNKKNHGKVPKKFHKAEREKLKRDHLNDLFLELGSSLDPTRQNNGKASILGDATRLLRELLDQVERLKKENVALLSESHYVNVEKNELRDENDVLETQIEKLHAEVKERTPTEPAWNPISAQPEQTNLPLPFAKDHLTLPIVDPSLQSPPVVAPIFVIPLHHDFQSYPEPGLLQVATKTPSNISRPHARYPTPSDSWPSQLLGEQSKKAQEEQAGSIGCDTNKEDRGSGNA